jgi:hypothetical protein
VLQLCMDISGLTGLALRRETKPAVWTGSVNRTLQSERLEVGGDEKYESMINMIKKTPGNHDFNMDWNLSEDESESDDDVDMDTSGAVEEKTEEEKATMAWQAKQIDRDKNARRTQ